VSPPGPDEDWIRRSDLDDLVDIDELRDLLGRGSRRRERVARSYADSISRQYDFPRPLITHKRVRLWLRAPVIDWMDQNRPGWRDPI